jgi:eukaryotic-like serine/threonine-protein kinase
MINFVVGQRVGKYEIKKFLGSGAFGSVYEAVDTLLQRHCALKFVRNSNPTQFVAHYEAMVLNKCRHDRIVNVHAVDVLQLQNGETLAVIEMEYCGDGSVETLLQKKFLSIRRSVRIIIDVCYGLEHAHRQAVLHRDIKPPNIMVAGSRYKLSDFGLAKTGLIGSGAGTPPLQGPGTSKQ